MSKERDKEIVHRYKDLTQSISFISFAMSLGRSAIVKALKDAGIELRAANKAWGWRRQSKKKVILPYRE